MTKRVMTLTAVVATGVAAVALLLLGGLMVPGAAGAQTEDSPRERTITVSGQGRVTARPDVAIVRLGVQTDADSAADALEDNNVRMRGLISTTLSAGVAEDDIQTQGIRLHPIYSQTDDAGSPQLAGYRASNIVELTVRDLDNLGALLDAAIAAGGNTIEQIRFEVSDNADLLEQARTAAMDDAIRKARQLTALADAEIGEVLTIMEMGGSMPSPFALEAARSVADVPVAPGMLTVETSVQVTWRIR